MRESWACRRTCGSRTGSFFNCLSLFCMFLMFLLLHVPHVCSRLPCAVHFGRQTLTVTVVGYVVFMLPANLTMRVVGAPMQLGVGVVFFGISNVCLSAARTYSAVAGL